MVEPLLIELKRIATRAQDPQGVNETQALLVDLMLLRARLMAARDEQGRAIGNLQRNVAATNAYRRRT